MQESLTQICSECGENKVLVPMGLFGTCYHVCKECKDKIKEQAGISNMSYGMQHYFETGIDSFSDDNDGWE